MGFSKHFSLLFQTLSAALFQPQSKWIYNSKPCSSWIFVLAVNQELAPAVLASNLLNSFLFFTLMLRVRDGGKEIHSFFPQVFIGHLLYASHWGYSSE